MLRKIELKPGLWGLLIFGFGVLWLIFLAPVWLRDPLPSSVSPDSEIEVTLFGVSSLDAHIRGTKAYYDRGFNDALEFYALLRLAVDISGAGVATIPRAPGTTYGEWRGMNFGDRFDVLREMYGVEKAEAD